MNNPGDKGCSVRHNKNFTPCYPPAVHLFKKYLQTDFGLQVETTKCHCSMAGKKE